MKRLRILTWHVHGSYLKYLATIPHDFFLPIRDGRPEGYGGKAPGLKLGDNVHDVPAEAVHDGQYDVVITQSKRNWAIDQHEILAPHQFDLPRLHIEHDPPEEVPTNTRHPVDDPRVLVVHVTHFNRLMWDNGAIETAVVDHGVSDPGHLWTGTHERGLVVVNDIVARGRRLGADVWARARDALPLDLVGMAARQAGGLGEVPLAELPAFSAPYRFFFHPIRYTSLGLAFCEAMMLGLPVVGLATTELPAIVTNGRDGIVDTDEARLHDAMRALLADHGFAAEIGAAGRRTALERFGLDRFARDWNAVLQRVAG